MRINQGLMTSNTDSWATPQWLFDKLNTVFGFTLDVCASIDNYKVRRFFTAKHDGLKQDWSKDICWMNPPYGREIGKWVQKAYIEAQRGAVVVGLLPARTDTIWFHDWVYHKAEIILIKGRLKFGDGKGSAPFPSMIAIWRHKLEL